MTLLSSRRASVRHLVAVFRVFTLFVVLALLLSGQAASPEPAQAQTNSLTLNVVSAPRPG